MKETLIVVVGRRHSLGTALVHPEPSEGTNPQPESTLNIDHLSMPKTPLLSPGRSSLWSEIERLEKRRGSILTTEVWDGTQVEDEKERSVDM